MQIKYRAVYGTSGLCVLPNLKTLEVSVYFSPFEFDWLSGPVHPTRDTATQLVGDSCARA